MEYRRPSQQFLDSKPSYHPFFYLKDDQGRDLGFLAPALIAQAQFLSDRPIMEEAHAQDFDYIIDRLREERKEFEDSLRNPAKGLNNHLGEVADQIIFGISAVIDTWYQMNSSQRDLLLSELSLTCDQAKKLGLDETQIGQLTVGVINYKNALNFPAHYLNLNLNGRSKEAFEQIYHHLRVQRAQSSEGILPLSFKDEVLDNLFLQLSQVA